VIVNIIIFINYFIVLIFFIEFFSRDDKYIDFGFMGIFLILIEIFIVMFFLFLKKKNKQQLIFFIGSVFLAGLYFFIQL